MMKKRLLILLILALMLCLCACGQPEAAGGEAVIATLDPDLLTGELPPALACFRGDHAQAPYLLVGTFESGGSLTLKSQLSPEMEPSGLGSLSTELELPEFSTDALYGVVTTLSVSGPQTVSAVFPLTQLPLGSAPVNQKWTEGVSGEYMIPVAVCLDGEEYYLISLTDGSVFRPDSQLPPELTAKAVAAAEIGTEVDLSHCGIAQFSILDKGEDGSYRIELKGFLCL